MTTIVQINRALSVPIYTQIVGQIQFDIVSGRLAPSTQLPSIRDLADELDVAPMTVSQAYQELKQLGLIEMQIGRGTFVAVPDEMVDGVRPNRTLRLRRILQRAVAEAADQGFSEGEIKQVFLSVLTDSQGVEMDHIFVMAGLWQHALEVYADDIERQLAAERIVVNPVTFADLSARPSYHQPWLDRATALLVPIHQVRTVHDVLASAGLVWHKPTLGLNFTLRPTTVATIQGLPPAIRLAILSRVPEFLNSMVQGVEALHPCEVDPIAGLVTDDETMQSVATSAQAVIYASGCEPWIDPLRDQMADGTAFIEYLHTPDTTAYERIRSFAAAGVEREPA